jgi:hypothetical protein
MIDFYKLNEIQITLDEFMNKILEFNFERREIYSKFKGKYDGFYSYMVGLSKFGEMIFATNPTYKSLKIYREEIKDGPWNRKKYHAIDSTGLSYGYIYGPIKDEIFEYHTGNGIKDYYYGCWDDDEKCIYTYDCVAKMGAANFEESKPVNLDELRKNYLPLLHHVNKGFFHEEILPVNQHYFWTDNWLDNRKYGPIIYRNDKRSFYLPFVELLRKELKLDRWPLDVKPKREKDCFSFQATYSWETRKYDHWKKWKGEITYDTFEIINSEFLGEESKYNN